MMRRIVLDTNCLLMSIASRSGNAELIVSNDSHFNILNQIDFPRVRISRIEEFIKM